MICVDVQGAVMIRGMEYNEPGVFNFNFWKMTFLNALCGFVVETPTE